MGKTMYFSVYRTARNVSTMIITKTQFGRLTALRSQDGWYADGKPQYVAFDKSLPSKVAIAEAKACYQRWKEHGEPTISQIREAVKSEVRKALLDEGHGGVTTVHERPNEQQTLL